MEGKKVLNNFIWRLMERFGAQIVSLVVSIVLARLLDPVLYGTIAIVTVFITILQVFVDSGLGNSLIQKKDADDLDFSTVFYFNIVVCLLLYAAMFAAAPMIARFYDLPELTAIIRVMSLVLIISGVKNVQQAYVSRQMLFKRFFFATLGGTIGAAVLGVTLAMLGFGVWALVAQHLFNLFVDTVILWVTVRWRPKRMFSFARLKGLFSYGWKLLASSLLDTVYNDLRQIIIGKMYSADDLAYYNRGKQFPNLVVTNINTSINSVLLPSMAAVQDQRERVKSMTRRSIRISTYLMAPLMIGLAVCAEPVISLLLTDKWLPAVPFMRVFCITMMVYPIHTANLQAIKAMGRSDIFLKLEIIKKAYGLAAILITMWISVEAMAYSLIVTTLISCLVNAFPNRRLLSYRYREQLRDLTPPLLLSLLMGVGVYLLSYLPLSPLLLLLIQVPTGAAIYLLGSILFRMESFTYLKSTLLSMLRRKKQRELQE